jgi:hypothetical protein
VRAFEAGSAAGLALSDESADAIEIVTNVSKANKLLVMGERMTDPAVTTECKSGISAYGGQCRHVGVATRVSFPF